MNVTLDVETEEQNIEERGLSLKEIPAKLKWNSEEKGPLSFKENSPLPQEIRVSLFYTNP